MYQPFQFCQICNRKSHTARTCFKKGCQICHRVGHTAATCFDRPNSSSQPMPMPPYSQQFHQFQSPSPTTFFNAQNSVMTSSTQNPNMMASSSYNPAMMMSQSVPFVAMTARISVSPSALSHEYWLLDSSATNHMTLDLSNL